MSWQKTVNLLCLATVIQHENISQEVRDEQNFFQSFLLDFHVFIITFW